MAAADAANEARLAAQVASTNMPVKQPGETNTAFNARLTQWYKDTAPVPVMTPEQIAGGGEVRWVRTGAAGEGEYQIVMPIGSPLVGTKGVSATGGVNPATGMTGTPAVTPTGTATPLAGGDAALANILKSYGLEGIATTIATIRKDNPEISSDDLLTLLKTDPRYNTAYLTRFAGNAELMKKGLPTLDDRSYLKAEKEYENIFKAYGTTSLANRSMYAKLIGNSMDAVDVTERLQIGFDRLKADPFAEQAFRQFYPSLSNGDIVAAMLDPEEQLPALKRKAAAAEIGGSALAQGLQTSMASAESLAAFGITKAGAQTGYRYIAQALPRGQFLAEIAPEENVKYTQGLAEDITFRKNVEAEKKQAAIVNKELGRFGGESGAAGSRAFGTPTKGVI
jgi:hypothetical protein